MPRPSTRGFRQGGKKLYLPNVVITLLRKSNLPPAFAHFKVPLNWNKFDIRDYLRHAYNVEVFKVRSYVRQQKLVLKNNQAGRWKRPRSLKFMTVELKDPFEYPPEPKDLTPWSSTGTGSEGHLEKKEKEIREELQAKNVQVLPNEIGEMAKMLLDGRLKWQPGWKALGSSR